MNTRAAIALLALVAAVAARPALKAPRPQFPASFESEVRIESHSHGRVTFGEGFWVSDFENNRAIEDFKLHEEGHLLPFNIFHLERNDLGFDYELESFERGDCQARVVSGHIKNVWAWVENATYIGTDIFHHVSVDIWGANFGGVEVRVYVRPGEPNEPLAFNTRTRGSEFNLEFVRFDANKTIDSKYFDVPADCQSADAKPALKKPVGADPPRPQFPATFFSEVFVQTEENHEFIDGKGVWAVDYKDNKAVEDYRLHHGIEIKSLIVYELQRGDLAETFEVDSRDFSECRERTSHDHVDAWGWVQNATYIGKDIYHHVEIDLWELNVAHTELRVGVRAGAYSEPLIWSTRFPGGFLNLEFDHFTGNSTFDHKIFDIPADCQS